MNVTTAEQMKNLDQIAIESYGIPGILLMEQAASAVVQECLSFLGKKKEAKVLILAGKGKNGGDGFAVARLLEQKNKKAVIWSLEDPETLQGDAKINFQIVKKTGIPVYWKEQHCEEELKQFDLIVDGLFGTGLKREITGTAASWIHAVNRSGIPVFSIDIPSGVHADTGSVLGCAIKSTKTITFFLPKRGHFLYPGRELTGELQIADLSIPRDACKQMEIPCYHLTEREACCLLPERRARSNKGTYGKLFVLAGSATMPGAAVLAGKGAYHSGVGMVVFASPKGIIPVLQNLLPEAVQIPLSEEHGFVRRESIRDLEPRIKEAKAVVLGPGLGKKEAVGDYIAEVLDRITKIPMVIDADGLNLLAEYPKLWNKIKTPVLITPHPGEMSRLNGRPIKEILEYPIETACSFAKEKNCIVVLKDASTIIADPDGNCFINTTGTSAMAKAGNGDVLSGILGSFLAQGMEPLSAAALGVYVHGLAGELAAQRYGEYGVLAGQVAEFVAEAMFFLQKKQSLE